MWGRIIGVSSGGASVGAHHRGEQCGGATIGVSSVGAPPSG